MHHYASWSTEKNLKKKHRSYLVLLGGRGFNGLITEMSRSHVTSVNNNVDDWQLNVLRNPKNIQINTHFLRIQVYATSIPSEPEETWYN